MNDMNNFWGMGSSLGWVIGILFFVLIVGLLIGMSNRNKNSKHKYNSPLDILKTRYAKGEISKDEYDEKRRNIS